MTFSPLTSRSRLIIAVAGVLATQANRNRPWWRRRRISPIDFVDTAREVVTALTESGHIVLADDEPYQPFTGGVT